MSSQDRQASPPVELPQMLYARERRAMRQQELLAAYQKPLISFTMNIAGPVKNGPLIRRGFALGRRLLLESLALKRARLLLQEEVDEATGPEGLYVVDLDAPSLKSLTCEIEECEKLGRLFDLDVLSPDGAKLDRPSPRRCLICGGPAKECARSRTHSVPELQERTRAILRAAIDQEDAREAASLAVRSLLYEVATTPKPGLVDREGSGSHRDMDIFTFQNSCASLWPYFAACVRIGREKAGQPAGETLKALRFPGKRAEADMLRATKGVNTHKGAIYTMGITMAALGRLDREDWKCPGLVLSEVAAITEGSVARELSGLTPETARTSGERFYVSYGVTGVRGQAEEGFPVVLDHGLPVLEEGLAMGKSLDEAGAAALLHILAHTQDTNMISRGGLALQQEKAQELTRLLSQTPYPDADTLRSLDRAYCRENLSPGGSADLLALCYLLHFLKEEAL